jgi:hypothetical protein
MLALSCKTSYLYSKMIKGEEVMECMGIYIKVERGKMLVVCVNFDFKLLLLHFIVVLLDINTL